MCRRSAQAPWALAKTDPARMRAVLWALMDVMRHVAVVASPLMPTSSAAMLDQLAVSKNLVCTNAPFNVGGLLYRIITMVAPQGGGLLTLAFVSRFRLWRRWRRWQVPLEQRTLGCLAADATDARHAPAPGTPVPKPVGLFPRIELEGADDGQVGHIRTHRAVCFSFHFSRVSTVAQAPFGDCENGWV